MDKQSSWQKTTLFILDKLSVSVGLSVGALDSYVIL